MKKKGIPVCLLLSILLFFFSTNAKAQDGKVTLFNAPFSPSPSPDYSVTVNGQPLFVYNPKTKIGRDHPQKNMGMCYFDCADSAKIQVHANVSMVNVVIRPKSYGIKPVINGQDITFTILKNQKVTIEPDGYEYNALVIFANKMDPNPPQKSDPNVIYFGPGIHTPGPITIKSNQTVYIAGGAVVTGRISATGETDIKILGHGILDQSLETRAGGFINLKNCSNVTIDGPILVDCRGWCVHLTDCRNVVINDMKEICWRPNSDGIDVDGGSNVLIENCYIRNYDDGIVIKSLGGRQDNPQTQTSAQAHRVHNITAQNCIFWNDIAEPLEIGYELETDVIDSITFKNIDVIHAFHNNVISIHNSGQALVRDIRFEDIRVEDLDPFYCNNDRWPNKGQFPGTHIIELWIGKSTWTKVGGQGTIRNIYFKNISVMLKPHVQFPLSSIVGFDAGHTIEDITFDNFTVDGKKMMNTTDMHINTNPFTKKIIFR